MFRFVLSKQRCKINEDNVTGNCKILLENCKVLIVKKIKFMFEFPEQRCKINKDNATHGVNVPKNTSHIKQITVKTLV